MATKECNRWSDPIKRFLHKVRKTPYCWIFKYKPERNGYCRFRLNGGRVMAHRFSYSAFVGKIPDGLNVLHTCDVRNCVNPDHLFIGTQLDNMRDCIKKGRFSRIKINKNIAIKIRAIKKNEKLTNKKIGKMFNISATLVSDVINFKVWV